MISSMKFVLLKAFSLHPGVTALLQAAMRLEPSPGAGVPESFCASPEQRWGTCQRGAGARLPAGFLLR